MKKSIAVALCLCAGSTFAEGVNFGVEGGVLTSDLGAEDLAQTLADSTGRTIKYTEEKATSFIRLYAAFEVSEKVDLEVGYFNASSLDASFTALGTTATIDVGVEAAGFDYGLRYKPSDKFYLKVGLHRSEIEATVVGAISGYTVTSATINQTGTGTYFGAGFMPTEQLSLGFTYLSNLAGESDTGATLFYAGYQF
ncbi:hypothetical protein ACUM5Y_05150 [Marinomonas dokdonensis]|uniref:hypothetical protein n=1 Tax=Marinomonas dokdonensis TaxID=328224 RepID=UPI004055882A